MLVYGLKKQKPKKTNNVSRTLGISSLKITK